MDSSSKTDLKQIQLGRLHLSPDGTNSYVAQQPGDLRLFCEALRASPQIIAAVTSIHLGANRDGAAASGVLNLAEDLRQEYGIDASGANVIATQEEEGDDEMADGDSDSDSDATIILDELGQEEEELDTSDENKENVAPRTPSPDNVDAVTPVSPPASTTEPTPSPPPENFPPFDYWGTAIGDFEVAKATANIEPTKEVPTKMYLDLDFEDGLNDEREDDTMAEDNIESPYAADKSALETLAEDLEIQEDNVEPDATYDATDIFQRVADNFAVGCTLATVSTNEVPSLQVYLNLLADILSDGLPTLRRLIVPGVWADTFDVCGIMKVKASRATQEDG